MSKLKELLEGVEVGWKPLGEVAELNRGKTITAKTKMAGNIPVISGGQTPAYYNSEYNRDGETITVAGSGAYAGFVMYWNLPIFVSDAFSVKPDLALLNTRYVFHFLLNNQAWIYNLQKGSGVPHVYPKDLAQLKIPIPYLGNPQKSLEIQKEIVRILDTFTERTETLINELTTELEARKKQYNYYREKLLSFKEGEVEWKTLGEIGEVHMCKRIFKEQTSDVGEIPFYKIGTFGKEANAYITRELFNEYKSKYNYPRIGEVLISASGTIGRSVIFDGSDAYFQDSNIVWIENDEGQVLNKYLFYVYQIVKWEIAEGGTIQRLYNDNLKKTKIPIPFPNDSIKSLEEQARIVYILDKLESLTTSISEALPKEITLRKKQYEYYRERLLTFK